mmetsp:Transcript_37693/g.55543  ORF Transcript_37693/g.55543 Transcript_37693/m.55543 type:complete len:246 (-) Transcript_37693:1234-1971(-)
MMIMIMMSSSKTTTTIMIIIIMLSSSSMAFGSSMLALRGSVVVVLAPDVDCSAVSNPSKVDVVSNDVVVGASVVVSGGHAFAPQETLNTSSSPWQFGIEIPRSTVKSRVRVPPPPQLCEQSDHSVQSPIQALTQSPSSQGIDSDPRSTYAQAAPPPLAIVETVKVLETEPNPHDAEHDPHDPHDPSQSIAAMVLEVVVAVVLGALVDIVVPVDGQLAAPQAAVKFASPPSHPATELSVSITNSRL